MVVVVFLVLVLVVAVAVEPVENYYQRGQTHHFGIQSTLIVGIVVRHYRRLSSHRPEDSWLLIQLCQSLGHWILLLRQTIANLDEWNLAGHSFVVVAVYWMVCLMIVLLSVG